MDERPLPSLYMALVHYPVENQHGEIVTTSITTFDIHDGARIARTFGVKGIYYISPIEAQQGLLAYFKEYWSRGFGSKRNPSRSEAMRKVERSVSLDDTIARIGAQEGQDPLVVATSARNLSSLVTWTPPMLVSHWKESAKPLLLLFGTGWGLSDAALAHASAVLAPIFGRDDYNHLPVRSAMAIYLHALCELAR